MKFSAKISPHRRSQSFRSRKALGLLTASPQGSPCGDVLIPCPPLPEVCKIQAVPAPWGLTGWWRGVSSPSSVPGWRIRWASAEGWAWSCSGPSRWQPWRPAGSTGESLGAGELPHSTGDQGSHSHKQSQKHLSYFFSSPSCTDMLLKNLPFLFSQKTPACLYCLPRLTPLQTSPLLSLCRFCTFTS